MGDEILPVKFNAVINEPPPEEPDPPIKVEPVEECSACPMMMRTEADPLSQALPTILVGIGVAYLMGLITATIIFSPPIE